MEKAKKELRPYERVVEISTWIVVIIVLFVVRFLPIDPLGDAQTYLIIGIIVSFALLYYLVIYRFFSKSNRLYLKSIADIVLIGVLLHLLKDYGQFFFTLYFLPIAAAALSLELLNALLIATVASLFVVGEIFLGAEQILPVTSPVYQGFWQIGFILFITIFCRVLAIQLKKEQELAETSLEREKVLEIEAIKEKEFLSLTSHQLYTPTSIIRGFSSLLKEEDWEKLNPKQQDAVEEIYSSSKRMADLVSELLSISRIEAGGLILKPVETDVKALLENIAKQMRQVIHSQNQIIELEAPEFIKNITVDPERFRDVVSNLISNAIKYCPNGKIIIKLEQDEANTKISVSDSGVGINEEDFEKLFQPFFRGKNILELDNKGTGLGLYIARLIVEKHGGKIWVESKINQGSKFIFTLPNK